METLKLLDQRYQATLKDLDDEFKELESSLETMMAELVVVK